MGWFSKKTKYYVASQIYNMAGDVAERPNHMKSLIVQSALAHDNVAERLRNGIINGPGSSLEQFQKWANTRYRMGLPTADITGDEIASLVPVRNAIPIPSGSPAGTYATVLNAEITEADASYWVEDYLLRNYPNLLLQDWAYEQDDVSNQIVVSFASGRSDIIFNPTNWVGGADYVAARYVLTYPGFNEEPVAMGSFGPFRTANGTGIRRYSEVSRTALTPGVVSLDRREVRVVDYADDRPSVRTDQTTSQVVVTAPEAVVYRWDENRGFAPGTQRPVVMRHTKRVVSSQSKRQVVTRNSVTYPDRIETSTVYQDVIMDTFNYTYTTQLRYNAEISSQKVFLYRIGSGTPTLDNLRVRRTTQREFFPVFPLRLNGRFINQAPHQAAMYEPVSRAYKKAYGDDIDKLLEELADNDSIDDLDFAFLVFGVSLNETDKSGKRYIYEFFKGLMGNQLSSKSEWLNHQSQGRLASANARSLDLYSHRMTNRLRVGDAEAPAIPQYPAPQRSQFILDQNIPTLDHYRVSLSWSYIAETIHAGKGRPGAKKDDIWFTSTPLGSESRGNVFEFIRDIATGDVNKPLYMYHQVAPLRYRRLEIVGMVHSNYVYKNKSVVTWAHAEHRKSEESAFFVPLHYPTLRKLPPVHKNQLAYCSRLLVLNSYQKVTTRWYQRGIFKVVFAIAMIAISFVVLGPAGLAATPGILGTNIAVGTAIGLAGTAAIIAGAAANMIAAIILTTIISKVSVDVFGEKFGHMIAAVATFFAFQMGSNFAATGSLNMDWSKVFNPQNLMNLTKAVGQGYQGMVNAKMQDLLGDYETAAAEYKDEMKVIEDRMNELYGDNAWINPMLMAELGDARENSFRESSGVFLQRTLLTGSDIAELSMSMISEFPSASIRLPDAIM